MAALNKNNSAVKRIMQEARELANDPCTDYSAAPLEDDIFEWHCTMRGPEGTEFEGGLYHFRILLPAEYPFRPPSLMVLTPNGRFELNTKICISFTSYHEEMWQPAWGVRTAILGLQGFFPLKGQAALGVGSIEYPVSERKRLAALSREWVCPHCKQTNLECLPDPRAGQSPSSSSPSSPPAAISGESATPPSPVQNDAAGRPEDPVAASATSSEPLMPPLADAEIDAAARSTEPTNAATTPQSDSASISAEPVPLPANAAASTNVGTPARATAGTVHHASRPPLLLDTAICVLLVLVFALICRRIF